MTNTRITERRPGLRAWAVAGVAVVTMGLGLWWLANWGSTPGDRAVGDRLVAAIAAMPDGTEVDLAEALGVPWDRAVLMEPYSTGADMNARLGFPAFADDASGPADEANQFVVFVKGESVVTTSGLFPGTRSFRFDSSIPQFSRDDARFVVVRSDDGVTLARP